MVEDAGSAWLRRRLAVSRRLVVVLVLPAGPELEEGDAATASVNVRICPWADFLGLGTCGFRVLVWEN